MDLKGRDIALSGSFDALEPGETERRLETAGVHVMDELTPSTAAIFIGRDPAALATADPAELEEMLRDADWAAFVSARGLPPLRARLTELEGEHGLTPAHRLATNMIRLRGTMLSRPYGHRSKITALALSPSGTHLATGDWGEGDSGTAAWPSAPTRSVCGIRSVSPPNHVRRLR